MSLEWYGSSSTLRNDCQRTVEENTTRYLLTQTSSRSEVSQTVKQALAKMIVPGGRYHRPELGKCFWKFIDFLKEPHYVCCDGQYPTDMRCAEFDGYGRGGPSCLEALQAEREKPAKQSPANPPGDPTTAPWSSYEKYCYASGLREIGKGKAFATTEARYNWCVAAKKSEIHKR
ncbi:MAG: hypothetical protein DRR08_22415 [Candidatus Parabeggiatoa sp. nov. 2]|nr:MAG: hypothetical protein B6247_18095 [Beggiatoa sp. 4572_84]RKZ56146.1 MAG: hypothetical protein DRR08_22415 [Gammaproteobacteria bacterium]